VQSDHVAACKVTMHKTAFFHHAHNRLHDLSFRSHVILMRFDCSANLPEFLSSSRSGYLSCNFCIIHGY
jgi:hypothetical protein